MNHDTKTTITPAEHVQLHGLKALAETQVALLKKMEAAASAIVGETEETGHVTDCLWGSTSVDEMLKRFGITVADEGAEA